LRYGHASQRKGLGLETRTGLHLGECDMRGEEVTGLAVHTAARVMSVAGGGEILISEPMRDGLRFMILSSVQFSKRDGRRQSRRRSGLADASLKSASERACPFPNIRATVSYVA